jgi:hypothetical protein
VAPVEGILVIAQDRILLVRLQAHIPRPWTSFAKCLIDETLLSRCLFWNWNDCRLLWAAICLSSPLVSAVDDYEALVDPNTGLPMTSRCDA